MLIDMRPNIGRDAERQPRGYPLLGNGDNRADYHRDEQATHCDG